MRLTEKMQRLLVEIHEETGRDDQQNVTHGWLKPWGKQPGNVGLTLNGLIRFGLVKSVMLKSVVKYVTTEDGLLEYERMREAGSPFIETDDDREEPVTTEGLDAAVREIAEEDGIEKVLAIPGVWEIVSEHYNNDAIDRVREKR